MVGTAYEATVQYINDFPTAFFGGSSGLKCFQWFLVYLRSLAESFYITDKDRCIYIYYASWGPIFWPFLRSPARAPTIKAVRGSVAIKDIFGNFKGPSVPVAGGVRSPYGAFCSPYGGIRSPYGPLLIIIIIIIIV